MRSLSLKRLRPDASAEDRRDFADNFNGTLDHLDVSPGDVFVISVPDGHPPPLHGHCQFCGDLVDPDRVWRRESGYTKPRSRGGTNALAIRRVHEDELACDRCISRLKRGVAPTQASLL